MPVVAVLVAVVGVVVDDAVVAVVRPGAQKAQARRDGESIVTLILA